MFQFLQTIFVGTGLLIGLFAILVALPGSRLRDFLCPIISHWLSHKSERRSLR
jgi:hypothetical protein